MKLLIPITGIFFMLAGCASGQRKDPAQQVTKSQNEPMTDSKRFIFSLATAHPEARMLMNEEFYWNPIEETAPFGSDDGSDAAYGFRQWRQENPAIAPLTYLKELIGRWGYPYFDWNTLDTIKIRSYLNAKTGMTDAQVEEQLKALKEAIGNSADTAGKARLSDEQLRQIVSRSSGAMPALFLLGQDNAIIGTGFAQFVIEGKIDNDLKTLTKTAIQRQLLPVLINRYDEDYRARRRSQLSKMLDVVEKMKS